VLTDHSGGEEVLLDVGGQDATEAFEDVGHSDEAREILQGLLVGSLKRMVRLSKCLHLAGLTNRHILISP
jgi:cytochrome b involved in lipid metabolism